MKETLLDILQMEIKCASGKIILMEKEKLEKKVEKIKKKVEKKIEKKKKKEEERNQCDVYKST